MFNILNDECKIPDQCKKSMHLVDFLEDFYRISSIIDLGEY